MLTCEHCDRTFAGKRAFNQHLLSHETVKVPPPTLEELWIIVKKLVEKNNKLERKVKRLLNVKEKSKINIVDWLNENQTDAMPYMEWRKSWKVTDEEMLYLFEHKYVNGVFNILKNNLKTQKIFPIRAFKKRSNNMYIYDNSKWRKMLDKDFASLTTNTQTKIAGAFIRWQKLNPTIVNNDRDGKYERLTIEAFGGPKSKEIVDKAIRKKLFDFVKMDFSNFREYDFS